MPDPAQTSWLLISVLFSNVPLTASLAALLHHTAVELHRTGAGMAPVAGDVVHGRVVDLRKDMLLGTIGGPAFEAELETERGAGRVRFLLTREGLDAAQVRQHPPRRELLN